MFDAFLTNNFSKFAVSIAVLSQQFPALVSIPTRRSRLSRNLHKSMHGISEELLERSRKERELGASTEDGEGVGDVDGGQSWTGRTLIGSLRE
jgi:hypothetical protein